MRRKGVKFKMRLCWTVGKARCGGSKQLQVAKRRVKGGKEHFWSADRTGPDQRDRQNARLTHT